jgi:hypothetical protein
VGIGIGLVGLVLVLLVTYVYLYRDSTSQLTQALKSIVGDGQVASSTGP